MVWYVMDNNNFKPVYAEKNICKTRLGGQIRCYFVPFVLFYKPNVKMYYEL